MLAVGLGYKPAPLQVYLSLGADFAAAIRSTAGDWPAGTIVRLDLGTDSPATWVATVAGDRLSWDVDAADVDAFLAGHGDGEPARLWHENGGVRQLWAQGRVFVQ